MGSFLKTQGKALLAGSPIGGYWEKAAAVVDGAEAANALVHGNFREALKDGALAVARWKLAKASPMQRVMAEEAIGILQPLADKLLNPQAAPQPSATQQTLRNGAGDMTRSQAPSANPFAGISQALSGFRIPEGAEVG
ncbi:MAG: hypothetical protein PW734_03375 [Verrucomicrobium sp.]|nr:hypothetical protein [Verrucomicrobium sp.]